MRKLLVIVFLCCVKIAVGQDFSYSIRNYKAINGLPQSQVDIMLEDKNGYLWIGTQGGGLARFDGREFKVYTTLDGLQSNIINYLKIDNRQNLWIMHPRGITKFDGVAFKSFSQPGSPATAKRVRRAFSVKDTVFVVTGPGNLAKIYNDSVYYWSNPVKKDVQINLTFPTLNDHTVLVLSDGTFYVRSAQ